MSATQKQVNKKSSQRSPKHETHIIAHKELEKTLKEKDGIYVDVDLVPKALAQVSAMGAKMNRKAVALAQICVFAIENGERRSLTIQEASAFVRSGYTVPHK